MAARLVLLAVTVAALVGVPAGGPGAAELRPPQREPAAAREAARRVLDRPEYRRPAPTLLQRARRWVVEQLERLLGGLLGGGRGETLFWVVAGVGLLAVIVMVFRFSRGVSADVARRVSAPVTGRRTAAEWRAEAQSHEAAGRWRAGLRCRYRALVAELVDRGLVDDVPGRTAGEYRSEVRERVPEAAEPFGAATDLFEQAWYGNRPTGEDEAAAFERLAGRVVAGAGR